MGSIRGNDMSEFNGRGIDLEIYEDGPLGDNDLGVIKPKLIRINGVECITDNTPVEINGLIDETRALTATLTLYVRSLKVYGVYGEPS